MHNTVVVIQTQYIVILSPVSKHTKQIQDWIHRDKDQAFKDEDETFKDKDLQLVLRSP